ncbi:MAG: right-handed parallel beta-helix repeat-containing protein, partial [Nanoarchaeota archaeon]|nr:right-handed parallel beta-helix repeat-containing protein [Nanoarchaeota archaeon]
MINNKKYNKKRKVKTSHFSLELSWKLLLVFVILVLTLSYLGFSNNITGAAVSESSETYSEEGFITRTISSFYQTIVSIFADSQEDDQLEVVGEESKEIEILDNLPPSIAISQEPTETTNQLGIMGDVSACGTITEDSTLIQDIESNATCFTVTASNIVLDGAGYSITGNNTYDTAGIEINGVSNVTVKNFGSINNYSNAISIGGGGSHTVFNNTLVNTVNGDGGSANGMAVVVAGSSNNFSSNTITTTGFFGAGFYLISTGNIMFNNTVTTSGSYAWGAISNTGASSTSILSNTFTTSGDDSTAIYLGIDSDTGDDTIITGNVINTGGSSSSGIIVATSQVATITENEINTAGSSSYGLFVNQFQDAIISENVINTTGTSSTAVGGANSQNITFLENVIDTYNNDSKGISFNNVDSSNVSANNITTYGGNQNVQGMFIDAGSQYNVIQSNIVNQKSTYSDGWGINLRSSPNNNISLNTLNLSADNQYHFMIDNFSDNVLLRNNTLLNTIGQHLISTNCSGLTLLDQEIRNYSFTEVGVIFKDNNWGELK